MKNSKPNLVILLLVLLFTAPVCSYSQGYWDTGGNFLTNTGILGTSSNFDILFRTDGINRMRLMETGNTTINGSIINTSGFLGLHTTSPWSMFHIQGPNNTPWGGNGFREWMHTGTYLMENSDNLYVGMKNEDFNRSDAIWAWGDDSTDTRANYTRFIFTRNADADGDCTVCPTDPEGLYGREVLRLAPNGYIGVGPLFESVGIKSNIHTHMEDTLPVWFQQSSELGTGNSANDGLRMGIDGEGRSYIYNQENRPIILSTDNNTTNEIGNERIRISHLTDPETPNIFGWPIDLTRIGVSLTSTNPVNQPRSLMHLGSNVDDSGGNTEGWRFWMNNGIYMRQTGSNMYTGMMIDGSDGTDAVIAWGDEQDSTKAGDNLRFIFASKDGGTADPISQSTYGMEVARFASTGEFGIGNFSTNGLDEEPTQRLDVNGTARLRMMPNDTMDVVITGVYAENPGVDGDYVLNYATIEDFADAINAVADCDWEVIENAPGIDDVITGHGSECYPAGHTGIGTTYPQAKLDVFHSPNQQNPKNTGARILWGEGAESNPFEVVYGTFSAVKRLPTRPEAIGVHGEVHNARRNYAGDFRAYANTLPGGTAFNYGVRGMASGNATSWASETVGGSFVADAGNSGPGQGVFGLRAKASQGASAYGIFAGAAGASIENWAAFFVGDTHTTGVYTSSDETLKQNIEPLEGALGVIEQILPRQYDYQVDAFSRLNLPSGQQQGVIAQELEEVLPNLVKQTTLPAEYDTLGNEILGPIEYKSVNYIGLIPYLTAGIKEQQVQITEQAQSIDDLQQSLNNQNDLIAQMMDQLAALGNQVSDCCQGGYKYNPTEEGHGNLNNKPAPNENVLNQNTPNPFRSQTTISYKLEQGGKVMLNIYDRTGKPLVTLVEAEQQAGTYRYQWDASGLPAGVYNYALYVDGELLVKKAIKLAD